MYKTTSGFYNTTLHSSKTWAQVCCKEWGTAWCETSI